LLEIHHLNIIGGCCGTTDAHIRVMAEKSKKIQPLQTHPQPLPVEGGEQLPEIHSSPLPQQGGAGGGSEGGSPLFQSIIEGDSEAAVAATNDAIAQGIAPQEMINGHMIPAMSEIGRRFQEGKAFVPQLLMAGRAMKAALELLKPVMAGTASCSLGKVVIGTVKGDLHDIGKNLVASMLEGCGFEVVNMGIDVSADAFIQAVKENQPDILCMSALLTTTMGYMKEVIDALEAAGIRQQVKVMVGGAPVTQGFADEIGADGYSDNANSAVIVAKQLLKL
jgi:corrinoid protein of di/trimethylamine methyltransferase